MLGDTIGITYATVAKTLTKVNQDNFGAVYYLEDGDIRFTMKVSHSIPARGKDGESHHARLDVEHYDATTGELTRVASSWAVFRTNEAVQDSSASEDSANALTSFLTAANITKLVGRES